MENTNAAAPAGDPIRFALPQSETQHLPDFPGLLSVSPDGRHLAFVSGEMQDKWLLKVRALGSLATRVLAGTEQGFNPFWSPDSRFVGFTTHDGRLKIIDASGGPAVTLIDRADRRGAWGSQGIILFERFHTGFFGSPASKTDVCTESPRRAGRRFPSPSSITRDMSSNIRSPPFLPDGRRFVFTALSRDPAESGIYVGSIDSPARTRLLDLASGAQYASGWLLYQRNGALMAQPFDAKNGRLTGEAVRVVESVDHEPDGSVALSASQTGVLAYRVGVRTSSLLIWVDSNGKVLETVGDLGE